MLNRHRRLSRRTALRRIGCAALLVMLGLPVPAFAQDAALAALIGAYPDFLAGQDGKVLIWKDGTQMPLSDGRADKSFEEKLARPSILDQLSLPYAKGRP